MIFISCNKKESISDLIVNQNYQYWLVVKNADEKSKAECFSYFDKNGKWLVFERSYSSRKFSKLDRGDVYFIETWKLINDSIIDIGTTPFYIKKINKKEFVLESKINGYIRKLIVAPDSLIPYEYQRFQ